MGKIDSMPTLLTEHEININISIHKVFAFVSNMENFKLWFPEVLDIVSENKLEHATIGKTYLEIVNLPPHGAQKLKIEVKKVENPVLYVTESEYEPLLPRMTIKLKKENENHTTINWRMESRNIDEDFKINMLPNFKTVLNDRAKHGLRKLKEILEIE